MEWLAISAIATPLLKLVVAGAVGVLTPYLIYYVKQKTGIDLTDALTAQTSEAARKNVLAVEERALAQAKANQGKPSGADKFASAVKGLMTDKPDLTPQEAEKAIHVAVAETPGIGATGECVTISSTPPDPGAFGVGP